MQLPTWFPLEKEKVSSSFQHNTATVDIDLFHQLSYKDASLVYRALLRSAHNKSLLPTERVKYHGNKHFKSVFIFVPFTPPWFVRKLVCKVLGSPLSAVPVIFDEHVIPQMRPIKENISKVLPKLHGILSLFYTKEPAFTAASLDYILQNKKHSTDTVSQQQPSIPVPSSSADPVTGTKNIDSSKNSSAVNL